MKKKPLPSARDKAKQRNLAFNYRSDAAKQSWRVRRENAIMKELHYIKADPPFKPEVHDFGDIQLTLNARQGSHGDFTDNARVMQQMKDVARTGNNWQLNAREPNDLSYVQREAVDMILHKLGRIVTGNPNVADHWADIEGYARLARERLA